MPQLGIVGRLPLAPPLDPSRDEARRWVWDELSDPAYAQQQPGWTERALLWLWDQLNNLQVPGGPGGTSGLVLLVVLLVLVVLVVWLRAGPLRGSAAGPARRAVLGDEVRTAQEHRALADAAAAQGRWAEAVRERFRAVVRSLEERGLVDELPGRTAQEVARDASAALPQVAVELHDAASLFDDVTYGSRVATADHDGRVRLLDERVTAARPSATAHTSVGPTA